MSTGSTSNAAKQSRPCAHVSIRRAVASERAAMYRPPHGTRSRSSTSANAVSVASRASRHASSSSSRATMSRVVPPESGSRPSRTLAVATSSDTHRCSIVSATLHPAAGVGVLHSDSIVCGDERVQRRMLVAQVGQQCRVHEGERRVSPMTADAELPRPLAGVRVLDLSRIVSGPMCGRILADLGADVVKIEPPTLDTTRMVAPGSPGTYFAQMNAGKRNVCVDITQPRGAEVLAELADRGRRAGGELPARCARSVVASVPTTCSARTHVSSTARSPVGVRTDRGATARRTRRSCTRRPAPSR